MLHQGICRLASHSEITASVTSNSELSLQEPIAGKKAPTKKEKMTGGVNLKKSIAKKTKPKDAETNGRLDVYAL